VPGRDRTAEARRSDLEEGAARDRRRPLGDGVLMGRDLAIDLGTANTIVYRQGDGDRLRRADGRWRCTRTPAPSSRSVRRLGSDRRRFRQRRRRATAARGHGHRVRDDPALPRLRAPPRGAGTVPEAARLDLHPVGELGGREARRRRGRDVQRREAGDPRRGGARGGDRRRSADPRADRASDRRYRRGALGDGRRLDGRRGVGPRRAPRRVRPRRSDPGASPFHVWGGDRGEGRRGDQDRRSAPRSRLRPGAPRS
jgi:Actin-like ATPase involved in cell morphogenesis